jgi:LPS export ABC transporter permease LptG
MRILDRYILRNFLEPFVLCFAAFVGILLIFDLNDNLGDFAEGKAKWTLIALYYAHQLPHFTLLSMPLGLLLGLLYCLSKMSRSNEIISMLTAGRSVLRIIFPLFVVSALATALCLWLNYELAPQSDALRRTDMTRIKAGDAGVERKNVIPAHLMKDRMTNRVWFATVMRPSAGTMERVHITQLSDTGEPTTRWYAQSAAYSQADKTWSLSRGRQVNFDGQGNIEGTMEDWTKAPGPSGSRAMVGWKETPYRIASSRMDAEQLSVPDLRDYLASNSDFPAAQLAAFRTHLQYRWALPFTCLTVVFIAAPLGIVYSRRAVLTSVGSSLFIFFGYLLLMFLLLALGKGNRLSPVLAAWTPNAVLLAIGLCLLYLRSTNREFPKISFRRKR